MKKRRIYLVVLMVLMILLIACAILFKYVFVVRNVIILGDVAASEEEIVRIAHVEFGASVFGLNVEAMEHNLNATGTMYLQQIQLRYPDTLELSVATRNRDAMLLHMGKIQILDEGGYLVESLSEVPDMDLVYVSGMHVTYCETGQQLRANDGQIEAYVAVMQALNAHGAKMYASEIHLSDPEDIRLITRNGITVLLGDKEDMQDKVAWMKSAVADLENRGQGGGSLDVRSATKADYNQSDPDV